MKIDLKHFKGPRPWREVILEGLRKFYQIEEEKEKAYNRGYMQGKEDAKLEMAREEVAKKTKKGKESVERIFGGW